MLSSTTPFLSLTFHTLSCRFVGAVLHDLEHAAVNATSVHGRKAWPAVRVEELSQQLEDGRWQVAEGTAWSWEVLTGKHRPFHSFT